MVLVSDNFLTKGVEGIQYERVCFEGESMHGIVHCYSVHVHLTLGKGGGGGTSGLPPK